MAEFIEVNGRPVRDGETVTVDHSIQTITVKIRSMGVVDTDIVRNLLQQRYEVLSIEKDDVTLFVHAPNVPDFPQ